MTFCVFVILLRIFKIVLNTIKDKKLGAFFFLLIYLLMVLLRCCVLVFFLKHHFQFVPPRFNKPKTTKPTQYSLGIPTQL